MNFVLHNGELEKLLLPDGSKDKAGRRYAGCYVYCRDQVDTVFKLGMSEASLYKRVKDAKACYPFKTEFWLQFLIIVRDGRRGKGSGTRAVEKALLTEADHLRKTHKMRYEPCEDCDSEDALCASCSMPEEQGKRPREYRIAGDRKTLNLAVEKVLNQTYALWDHLVVFSENGWHIFDNPKTPNPIDAATRAKLWKKTARHSDQPAIERAAAASGSQPRSNNFIPGVLAVGSPAFVTYVENNVFVASDAGLITKKLKTMWKVEWANWKGKHYAGNYPFKEVFATRAEADRAARSFNSQHGD